MPAVIGRSERIASGSSPEALLRVCAPVEGLAHAAAPAPMPAAADQRRKLRLVTANLS
jgi:hypothetical protein